MKEYEKVCIVCPRGCRLTIKEDQSSLKGYTVEGNTCKRGQEYGIKEVTNPTRVLTSTVKLNSSHLNRLPVVTKGGIPKGKLMKSMKIINNLEIETPVKEGDIIIENILDTGIDLISSRTVEQ